MGNIFRTLLDNINIQSMPLETVHAKYGEGPEFYRELLQRSRKNIEEVRDFFKTTKEFDFSDFGDKCDLLRLSPSEVLSWGNVKSVPDFIANAFLIEDTRWMNTPIVDKVSKGFLESSLKRDDNIYRYPELLCKLNIKEHFKILTDPNTDYQKFQKKEDLLNRFTGEYLQKMIKFLIENKQFDILFIVAKSHYIIPHVLKEILEKKKQLPFEAYLQYLDLFPSEFIETFLSEFIKIIFYGLSIEQMMAVLKSNVITKFKVVDIGFLLNAINYDNYDENSTNLCWNILIDRKDAKLLEALNSFIVINIYRSRKPLKDFRIPTSIKDLFIEGSFGSLPEDIKERFKTNGFDVFYAREHRDLSDFFSSIDPRLIFSYIPVLKNEKDIKKEGLYEYLKRNFKEQVAYEYMSDVEPTLGTFYKPKSLKQFLLLPDGLSLDEVKKRIDEFIYAHLDKSNVLLDSDGLDTFKISHPEFFLPSVAPKSLKEKYYNRKLSPKDFALNYEWLDLFTDTNIAYGFPPSLGFLISLNSNVPFKESNDVKLKIFSIYESLSDEFLKKVFIDTIRYDLDNLTVKNLETLIEILKRIKDSNYEDFMKFRPIIVPRLLKSANPLELLKTIEAVFLKENIPFVGKIYTAFQLLNPNLQGFNFEDDKASPILKAKSPAVRQIIIFSDLMKAALGSNNRSLKDYIQEIEAGYSLFTRVKKSEDLSKLTREETYVLNKFLDYLSALYSSVRSTSTDTFMRTGNMFEDLENLKSKFIKSGQIPEDLPDRIVKMYCHFAGFDTMNSIKIYINSKVRSTDIKHRIAINHPILLKKGDFIKGISKVEHLSFILQNGVLAKEYMSVSSMDDLTPLDVELKAIESETDDFRTTVSNSLSEKQDPIFIVLKRDDRFSITRENGNENRGDTNKLEIFETASKDHYGMRTGFASTEIDYFLVRNIDKRIFLEIALNGFYIPVVDFDGQLIFTPQDFDMLRTKMTAIPYYTDEEFHFSTRLKNPKIADLLRDMRNNEIETKAKQKSIETLVEKTIVSLGLNFATFMTRDTIGTVEFISIGSTSRNTNMIGRGDFDFIMRLDSEIINNVERLTLLKRKLLATFGQLGISSISENGDIRLNKVNIDGKEVEIHIKFTNRTTHLSIMTDDALKSRLDLIKLQSPENYELVIANILLAKEILMRSQVYKSPRAGGCGISGIGVENWILQNGGSILDAIYSFLEDADGKTFTQFKDSYEIWDFGENRLASKYGLYPHDNFIDNLSDEGYEKMLRCLKEFLHDIENKKDSEKNLPNLS